MGRPGRKARHVYQNTPASDQLGLEPGDYILDVQGYPVGYYQGTYYGLGDLLNMNSDPQGWVNINIWNFRTGQDAPYWVRLQRR
jgi:C-terminal processing protease CtpA/Prc